LAHAAHLDRPECRRDLRLARALETRCHAVAAGLREGSVNPAQAAVIVRALVDLPEDLEPEIRGRAEAHLVEQAGQFGPRSLRILGRRVLQVVPPEVAEEEQRKLLERDEARAQRRTFLTSRANGDGTTDLRIRISDAAAGRLFTYLEAFTSPRRQAGQSLSNGDNRPYDHQLGHAFTAFLESVDPSRMPLHGGDATTVIITLDLQALLSGIGVALVGDQPITAGQARRLACTASIIPAVLGGESEVLDLGRKRRLFTPAQRKAMAIRDVTCRAEGCDIPAACSWHHHRAHDHRYHTRRRPSGEMAFTRRTQDPPRPARSPGGSGTPTPAE